jgi:hypothetical protein
MGKISVTTVHVLQNLSGNCATRTAEWELWIRHSDLPHALIIRKHRVAGGLTVCSEIQTREVKPLKLFVQPREPPNSFEPVL